LVERLRDGRIQIENKSKDIEKLRYEMRTYNRRIVLAVIGSGFFLSAAIIYGLDGFSPVMVAGAPWLTWVFGTVGLGLLFFSMGD
jgi:ubiquinone biosynthesis protein